MKVIFVYLTCFTVLVLSCERSKECLNVFESSENDNQVDKCYCTDLCPVPLKTLQKECTSGQLLPDECSTCLKCAKTRGQTCGGLLNVNGTCALGLKCLVRFNVPRDSNGRKEENDATGTCVPEDSSLCPGPAELSLEEGVNCRPGRLGIISEALYCPPTSSSSTLRSVTVTTTTSTPLPPTPRPGPSGPPVSPPTLIQILLGNVPFPQF